MVKINHRLVLMFILLFLLLGPGEVFACRYNVRDVAFVDFGRYPYRLYGFVNKDTPLEIKTSFEQIAYSALLDTNVVFELIDIDLQGQHPACAFLSRLSIDSFPAAIFVSPDQRLMKVTFNTEPQSFKRNLWAALENLVDSPQRREIARHIVEVYGVVLLVPGRDVDQIQPAQSAAQTALAQINQSMPYLSKAIKEPPVLLTLDANSFEQERVLLWSLGLEGEKLQQNNVVVLHGRGRQIGPVLSGSEITADMLTRVLSVIGADCECGLDRRWMQGTLIPLRWDENLQHRVADTLGFDPESPMIKSEISIIMNRGPSSLDPFGGYPDSQGLSASELPPAPGYGYREFAVVFDDSNQIVVEEINPRFPPPVQKPDAASEQQSETAPATALNQSATPGASADSTSSKDQSLAADAPLAATFRTSLIVLAGIMLFIVAAAVFILVRARGKTS